VNNINPSIDAAPAAAAAAANSSSAAKDIEYSDKYEDESYEYRHVILPRETAKRIPQPARLLTESEWRGLGVQQSRGWIHYEIHKPEPHILLFRRPLGTDPLTGKVQNSSQSIQSNNISQGQSQSLGHALAQPKKVAAK